MARNENPPFGRGETFYNGGSIDANNLGGFEFEGKMWVFEDVDVSKAGAKPTRSNRPILAMIVRNIAAFNILPKMLVNLTVGAGNSPSTGAGSPYLGQVDGQSFVTAQRAYPADEFLPAAGVPTGDLFWVIIEGPAMCKTPLEGNANNVFAVGDMVVALTAATSGATTSGRVIKQDSTGATTPLAQQIQNRVGHALSAATTANTNADLLVEVGKF